MKKLNFVLAAAMAASFISVPAVHAEEQVVLSQDFEEISSLDEAGFAWRWQDQDCAIIEQEGNKVLKMAYHQGGDQKKAQISLKNGIVKSYNKEGYLTVRFDVNPGLYEDKAGFSLIQRADGKNDVEAPFTSWWQVLVNTWPSICNMQTGTWYTVTNVINLANNQITSTVARKDGSIVASQSRAHVGDIDDIMLNVYNENNADVETLIDNITITKSDAAPTKTVVWSDNFNSYGDNKDALLTNQYKIPEGWSDANGLSMENGAVKLNPNKDGQTNLLRTLPSSLTGKIGIDVDVVPAETPETKVVVSDAGWGSEARVAISGNGASIVVGKTWTKIGDIKAGETYTLRMIIDTDNGTFDAAIIDATGKVQRPESAALYSCDSIGIVQLAQGAWEGSGVTIYDNLNITLNPDALPKIEPDPVADLQVTNVAVVTQEGTGDYADTVATGIKATVENQGNADGTVEMLTWTVGDKYIETNGSDFTEITIAPQGALVYGLIIDGLRADAAQVKVN